jgi:hypothetical protein
MHVGNGQVASPKFRNLEQWRSFFGVEKAFYIPSLETRTIGALFF